MNYEKKYLKYKNKYLNLKNQIGGYNKCDNCDTAHPDDWCFYKKLNPNPGKKTIFDWTKCKHYKNESLEVMPQLCLGTVQGTTSLIKDYLIKAIDIGYRHFDSATAYSRLMNVSLEEYMKFFGEGINKGLEKNKLLRSDIWITFKGSDSYNIKKELEWCKLEYYDLWLYHHNYSIGRETELEPYFDSGLIKRWGISNIYIKSPSYGQVNVKGHKIFANQIQANPANEDIYTYFNNLGIKVMLYAPISGIITNPNFIRIISNDIIKFEPNDIIKFYLNKYIYNSDNVLIVGTQFGGTLEINLETFNKRLPVNNDIILKIIKRIGISHMG